MPLPPSVWLPSDSAVGSPIHTFPYASELNVPIDLPVAVRANDGSPADSGPLGVMVRYVGLFGEFLSSTWQWKLPWAIGRG